MPLHVLLVEDNMALAQALCRAISITEDAGLVGNVASGEAALDWLAQHACDVLITDLHLTSVLTPIAPTVMSGLDVISAARRLYPTVRIILITAYADSAIVAEAAQQADLFLPKPFTLAELLHALRNLITTSSAAPVASLSVRPQPVKERRDA